MSPYVYYFATLVIFFFIFCISTWGLNLQFGTAGILNFTYITFFAIVGYFTGLALSPRPARPSSDPRAGGRARPPPPARGTRRGSDGPRRSSPGHRQEDPGRRTRDPRRELKERQASSATVTRQVERSPST